MLITEYQGIAGFALFARDTKWGGDFYILNFEFLAPLDMKLSNGVNVFQLGVNLIYAVNVPRSWGQSELE